MDMAATASILLLLAVVFSTINDFLFQGDETCPVGRGYE
jgi:hypothetical protein